MNSATVGAEGRRAFRPGRRAAAAAMVLAALALAAGVMFVSGRLTAAADVFIGYVDVTRIIDEYLAPALDEPLAQETARLQAEFDRRAQSLGQAERQELFFQYQALLNLIKQEMIDEHLPYIDRAVAEVAVRQGVSVVLEKQAVLYGGVDLTEPVLAYLRSGDAQAP